MRRTLSTSAAAFVLFLTIAFSVIAGLLILHGSDDQRHHVTVLGQRIQLTANESLGHQVFAEHCQACHQLAASNSIGAVGPDLDDVQPTAMQVENIVQKGAEGAYGVMPSGLATGPELDAVAQYVSKVANRKAYTP